LLTSKLNGRLVIEVEGAEREKRVLRGLRDDGELGFKLLHAPSDLGVVILLIAAVLHA
jgi:hypothetical protein